MPTLPQAIDYGARPDLNVNRLDRPTGAGAELAASLVQATSEFQNVMAANKEKEDALNYALARNEAQQLDIEERAKLADDLDWASHDQRYAAGYSTGLEEIRKRYNLSARDGQIFDSETSLINANGRIQVGGRARMLQHGEAEGRYLDGKAKARASIILADEGARNKIVLGQHEAIQAQVDAGFMTPAQGALEREELTQDFATASLLAMPPDQRYRVIRASLAYRSGYGASLGDYSDSFLRAAEATGVPAEVLHAVGSRESSLDPSKVNAGSGAAGLMQIMEGTAGDLGVTDRFDADQSIQGGAQYLAEQFERFGTPEEALAAYNWGPRNVADAQEEYGDEWLAYAPKETREYVAALAPVWEGAGEIPTDGTFNTGHGPLTAEDIAAGKGTGSIADFLHADTAAKMLEVADKEDKTNRQREEAQVATNQAYDIFPEDDAKRMKWLEDNFSGTVERMAKEDARQRNADEVRAKEAVSTAAFTDYSNQMVHEKLRIKDIPADVLTENMTPYHQDQLRILSERLSYDEQWAVVTQRTVPKPPLLGMSQEGWNAMPNYGKGSKAEANLETAEYYNAFTEKAWNDLETEQQLLQAAGSERITTHLVDEGAMVSKAFESMQFTKVDGDDDASTEFKGIRARLEGELRQRILQEQNSTTPVQQLDQAARNKILAELLSPIAFTDGPWWGHPDFDEDDKPVRVAQMTKEQLEDAFVDLDKANKQTMDYKGQELTVQQILEKYMADHKPDSILETSDHNMRRAAFAFLNNIGNTPAEEYREVIRRLKGE